MPKFFIENISGDSITINGGDVAHITRVLRLGVGDELILCDGKGFDYRAVIKSADNSGILCDITEKTECPAEPNIEVTLFQGIPKSSKMEYIIQKNTELGISHIVPAELLRCVSKLDKKSDKKVERWQKIANEAAKQSGRGVVPEVKKPMGLDEILKKANEFDIFFVPYECEDTTNIRTVLTSKKDVKTVGFMIGPEGGFDLEEIDKIRNAGIKTVTLGKRILRTETAGEAVLSMIMYEIGDINA